MVGFSAKGVAIVRPNRWLGVLGAFFARVTRNVEVFANGTGVYADGELVAPHAAIVTAYLQPRPAKLPTVKIETHAESLELCVNDEAEGRALLEAIGHDAGQAVVSFANVYVERRRSVRSLALVFLLVFASLAATAIALEALRIGFVTFPIVIAALIGFRYAASRPATLHVGPDGILLEASRGKSRFVPYGDVVSIDASPDGAATLVLRAGDPVVVVFAAPRKSVAVPALAAFVDRARAGLAAFEAGPSGGAMAALLARGARPAAVWARALLGQAAGGAYRAARIPCDRLWRLLEDASAATSARAGAAVLLRPELDDAGRRRLRLAAEACASPRLRVALDAAASADDDAAMQAALDSSEDDAVASRPSPHRHAG